MYSVALTPWHYGCPSLELDYTLESASDPIYAVDMVISLLTLRVRLYASVGLFQSFSWAVVETGHSLTVRAGESAPRSIHRYKSSTVT